MIEPREVPLGPEALAALSELLGIMTDQFLVAEEPPRWGIEPVADLTARIEYAQLLDVPAIDLGLDDVALLIDGMAFTEIASEHLPWIEMVRWASDFIVGELRQYWTEAEWQTYVTDLR